MPRALALLRSALLAFASAGCSWSRFGDVTENAPVVRLSRPDNMNTGFGVTLASGNLDGRSLLVVGGEAGTSPAALFDLGQGDDPNLSAIDSHFCNNAQGKCFLGSSVAYLAHTTTSEGTHLDSCIGLGLGKPNAGEPGVFFECQGNGVFSRPVLPKYLDDVEFALKTDQNETIALAGDGADDPALVVGAPSALTTGRAWYYAPGSAVPVELSPGAKTAEGYGTRVATIPTGASGWLFAVSAPNAGELHLFRGDGVSATYLGCLGGSPGFGRTLATGLLSAESASAAVPPELLVADYDNVYVLASAPLAALPAATGISCTLASLPKDTLRNSFGCGSTKDTNGCSTSDFGVALAVADVDGDGDGEALVGAPLMAVRGTQRVGAVLVYDLDEPGDGTLSDVRFIASGKEGDALGGAVAAGAIGGRDLIIGGETRSGQVSLHYCSALVPGALRGPRCQ